LHRGAVEDLLRAGQDHRADLVDDLRLCLVDRERSDVAPVERQGAAPRHKEAARVTYIVVELVWRPDLGKRLIDTEGRGGGRVVHERLHVAQVEESALLGAL